MAWRRLVWIAVGLASGSAGARAAGAGASSCGAGTTNATAHVVAAAGPEGVDLGGGERVRLADVRIAAAGPAGERAAAWLRSLAGQEIVLRLVSGPNRWAEPAAEIALAGRPPIDLATLLVGEGLAQVDAGEQPRLCRPALLAEEAAARAAARGVWAEPEALGDAADGPALARRAGHHRVVEGRIVSVGERRDRTYLNFGRDFTRDFSVVVPKRVWADLARRDLGGAALRGRRVRVRGVVEMRRGPVMELDGADMLELVEARATP